MTGTGSGAITGVRVETVRADGHIELTVHGEIDIAAVKPFEDAVTDALRHGCDIVIDLRKTTFLGVCALEPIIHASVASEEHQIGVTVVIGTAIHRRLLTLTGVDGLVTIEDHS